MKRCFWVNLDNPLYVKYHDEEWCVPKYDDQELFELLILEMFQAGLSWETILNKRENFRVAFDDFSLDKITLYDDKKIAELMENKGIIRNRRKIEATVKNARIFKSIQKEAKSFSNYIWAFTNHQVVQSKEFRTTSPLSDEISKDLKKRGMSFVGSTIIYSYLQAIGVLNDHDEDCFLYVK
ncbi:MAG: DNA-3-methyladenine glycosylase I [Bacilli bacterium]|nr:DNA-3-methyladenine glycosylase I [Bacilli bacterium]